MKKIQHSIAILTACAITAGCGNTSRNYASQNTSTESPAAQPTQTVLYSSPVSVGTGKCSTTRGRIIQSGNDVLIELQKPTSSCGFKEVVAYIGSQAYSINGTTGFSRNSNGNYSWSASSGFLFYRVGRTITSSEAASIKLHETTCNDSSCVTSFPERVAKSQSPANNTQSNSGNSDAAAVGAALGILAAGALIYGAGKLMFGSSDSSSSSGSSYGSGSSSSSSSSNSNQGNINIRQQVYDNAGRQADGYWVKCGSNSEQRIYRSAWDNSRDWYRPGFPTPYFVAKGNLKVEDVARKVCG